MLCSYLFMYLILKVSLASVFYFFRMDFNLTILREAASILTMFITLRLKRRTEQQELLLETPSLIFTIEIRSNAQSNIIREIASVQIGLGITVYATLFTNITIGSPATRDEHI